MVFLNYSTMEMVAKIVYYGPGLGGKTTNLKTIYQKTSPQSRGEMVSLATETDRTLFFDLLPMEVGVIGGFKTKFQLYTVPGQVFYNTTRKLVLRGVDGIVFVADSQVPMMDANMESFQNMKDNLAEINMTVEDLPIVLQYNKRDLPNVLSLDVMDQALNQYGFASVEASALNGVGVFETLREISKQTLMVLNNRNLKKGKPEPRVKASKPAVPKPVSPPPSAAMPEDVSFEDLGNLNDVKESLANTNRSPRDSFEQTLNNLDLNLSDDDDAFLEEDSLEMEEFDQWDEDSLESSLDDISDDTSPGHLVPDSDFGEVRTLQMGRLGEDSSPTLAEPLDEAVSTNSVLEDDSFTLADHDDDLSETSLEFEGGLDHHLDEVEEHSDMGDLDWDDKVDLNLDEKDDLDFDHDSLDLGEEPTVNLDRNLIPGIGQSLPLDEMPDLREEVVFDGASSRAALDEDHAPFELDGPDGFGSDLPLDEMPDIEEDEALIERVANEAASNFMALLDEDTDSDYSAGPLGDLESGLAEMEELATDMGALETTFGDNTASDLDDSSHSDLDYSLDHGLDQVLYPQAFGAQAAPEPEVPTEIDPSLDEAFGGDLEVIENLDADGMEDLDQMDQLAMDGGFSGELDFDVDNAPDLITDEPDTIDRYDFPEDALEENPLALNQETPSSAAAQMMKTLADDASIPDFEPDPSFASHSEDLEDTASYASPLLKQTRPEPEVPVVVEETVRSSTPRSTQDSLDELKRMTTRIQTSRLPGRKKASAFDDLLTEVMGPSHDKKSPANKFAIQVSKPIHDAQLNCVLVDEFQNVVHAELIKVKPRKMEDGRYQIQVTIDIELES